MVRVIEPPFFAHSTFAASQNLYGPMADRPQDGKTRSRSKEASAAKTNYLILYNFVSAVLWSSVLGRVLLVSGLHGYPYTYLAVGQFAKWTQTLAVLEVLHAALGT